MSSKLLRASCIGFCTLSLALAEAPSKAKPAGTQQAVDQKVDARVSKTPIGTLTADSPIRVNGVGLDGTTAWPVFPGDIIETYSTDANLKLKDGRSARLRKFSAVVLSGALATAALSVNRGSAAIYDTAGNPTQLVPQTSGSLFTTPSGKASSAPRLTDNWMCRPTWKDQCQPQDCKVPSPNTTMCCIWSGQYQMCLN